MPTTSQPEMTPGGHLVDAMAALARWVSREDVRRTLHAGVELPETGWWLLHRIGEEEPVRASALARWQGVDRSTMTTQVHRLVQDGLVDRRADPDDGRAALLRLTPAGRTAVHRSRTAGAAVFDRLLQDWDADDRHDFVRLSVRFSQSLEGPT